MTLDEFEKLADQAKQKRLEDEARRKMQAHPPRKWECAKCGLEWHDKNRLCKPIPLA